MSVSFGLKWSANFKNGPHPLTPLANAFFWPSLNNSKKVVTAFDPEITCFGSQFCLDLYGILESLELLFSLTVISQIGSYRHEYWVVFMISFAWTKIALIDLILQANLSLSKTSGNSDVIIMFVFIILIAVINI